MAVRMPTPVPWPCSPNMNMNIHSGAGCISRRRHLVNSNCRTLKYSVSRRKSIAGTQSNKYLPPTPCKTKSHYNHHTTFIQRKKYHRSIKEQKSRTPSPNKHKLFKQKQQKKLRRKTNKINLNYDFSSCFYNLGRIGIGSFSHVFKVKNALTKKPFALKKSIHVLNTRYF